MKVSKKQLFVEEKFNYGLRVAKFSYLRWLLFNSFLYERSGEPRFTPTIRSYRNRKIIQMAMYAMLFFSWVFFGMFILNYSTVISPIPRIDKLKVVQGKLEAVNRGYYFPSITIDSKGKLYKFNEFTNYLFKNNIGEEVTIYYGYSAKQLGIEYIYYAFSDNGQVIIDYNKRLTSAMRNKYRGKIFISLSCGLLILFVIIPYLFNHSKARKRGQYP